MVNLTTTTISFIINTPKYYNKFRSVQNLLIRITLPYIFIVAVVGLITNTATVVLLSKSSITKNTRHRWTLTALALSDLVHNSALLIRVIHDIVYGHIESLCIIISFLSHLAELLSACFTVLFTIQRYLAVRYPLKSVVHKRSSPILILFILFFSSLIFCLGLIHRNKYIDCHEELKLSWFIADALVSFIIPFSLILIFNICIVNLIRKHARSSISKQTILLRPLKYRQKVLSKKINQDDDPHSITYSCENPRTLEGLLTDTDIENKNDNTNSSIISTEQKKKPKLLPHMSTEHQTSEISNSTSPVEKKSFDQFSSNSLNNSTKSSQDKKIKFQLRKFSHQSDEIDIPAKRDSHTTQSIHVTRMLILVSTCFLLLNAPAHLCVIAMKIYTGIETQVYYDEHIELERFKQTTNLTNNQLKGLVFIQTNHDNHHNNNNLTSKSDENFSYDIETGDDQILIHIFYIAVLLTQFISYLSYSINFFLYTYSGITFRTSLKEFFNTIWKQ